MPANTQHILLNLEATPPPGAWASINARLDAEFDPHETIVAEKLYNTETIPPLAVWQNISLALAATEANENTPAKIVRFPFYKVAIAAALLGVVSYLTWNFLSKNKVENIVQNNEGSQAAPGDNPPAGNDDIAVSPSMPAIDASITSRRRSIVNIARRVNSIPVYAAAYVLADVPEETSDIHYAGVNEMRAATVTSRKAINGPSIRDANGNIIMDQNLVTGGNNNYVIITCPNGEQTRISAKFLPMLNLMNSEVNPAEYLGDVIHENSLWKGRFCQWRSKIMQQANFIPTAANFFDIMELKDMLEEQ